MNMSLRVRSTKQSSEEEIASGKPPRNDMLRNDMLDLIEAFAGPDKSPRCSGQQGVPGIDQYKN